MFEDCCRMETMACLLGKYYSCLQRRGTTDFSRKNDFEMPDVFQMLILWAQVLKKKKEQTHNKQLGAIFYETSWPYFDQVFTK